MNITNSVLLKSDPYAIKMKLHKDLKYLGKAVKIKPLGMRRNEKE